MVRFLGTIRFASRSCHNSREQCRRDDLESWVYMLIEFTEYASLPWSKIVDRDTVCKEKERLFAGICLFNSLLMEILNLKVCKLSESLVANNNQTKICDEELSKMFEACLNCLG